MPKTPSTLFRQRGMILVNTLTGYWARAAGGAVPTATGVNGWGLFCGGCPDFATSAPTTSADKYLYTGDTRSATTALGTARGYHCASSDRLYGVISGGQTDPNNTGNSIASTEKYTWTGVTRAAGTALTAANGRDAISSLGIAGVGHLVSNADSSVDKYTYTTDAIVNASVAGLPTQEQASTTNVVGYFGSNSLTASKKYTYSTATLAAGGTMPAYKQNAGAAGTTAVGIHAGGFNSSIVVVGTSHKVTYSGDTWASATAITARALGGAAGNATVGIYAGGSNGTVPLSSTSKYTFSGDTHAVGTALAAARGYLSPGCSTDPGGFVE